MGDVDLVVLKLHHSGASKDFEQDRNPLAGDALHQAFDATQGGVFKAHGLAGLEVAELLQGGLVAVLLELSDALHQLILNLGGLEPEAHQGGNAFGVAHGRNALLGLAGLEHDVAGEHGLKERYGALLGLFEFFVERQIDVKGLLRQVDLGNGFLAGLGVGQVPAVRLGWGHPEGVWGWRVRRHGYF